MKKKSKYKNEEERKKGRREAVRRYRDSKKGKLFQEKYSKSKKRKESLHKYNTSKKRKIVSKRYASTAKGKKTQKKLSKKYRSSIKGREYHRLYQKTSKYRDYINKHRRNKFATDLNFRLRIMLSNKIKERIKRFNATKKNKFYTLLGCDMKTFKNHIEKQFLPGMNWKNYGFYGWHFDHYKACSKFDLNDPEQQKECFNYKNIQPMWWEDNLRWGSKNKVKLGY